MEEIGVVKSTDGITAKVMVAQKSICEKCTAGTCLLTGEGAELDALNTIGAKEGQRVRVVLKPFSYIKGSIVVYGIPALSLIVGAVLGKEVFAKYFPGIDPEGVSAIFGFGAMAVSFGIVKLWSIRAGKKTEYKPVIEEIIE